GLGRDQYERRRHRRGLGRDRPGQGRYAESELRELRMPGPDLSDIAQPATPGLFTPGFTLYIALALDEADHQPESSAIGNAARITLNGFHRYLETLQVGTRCWAEHHAYLQIAIDLAAGRRTRKTTKEKMYQAADDEFEREYERIVSKTAMG